MDFITSTVCFPLVTGNLGRVRPEEVSIIRCKCVLRPNPSDMAYKPEMIMPNTRSPVRLDLTEAS